MNFVNPWQAPSKGYYLMDSSDMLKKQILCLAPFYRRGNWGSEWFRDFAEITHWSAAQVSLSLRDSTAAFFISSPTHLGFLKSHPFNNTVSLNQVLKTRMCPALCQREGRGWSWEDPSALRREVNYFLILFKWLGTPWSTSWTVPNFFPNLKCPVNCQLSCIHVKTKEKRYSILNLKKNKNQLYQQSRISGLFSVFCRWIYQ